MAAIGFNGPNPILEANFHLAGVHIRPQSITAWDEENLHPKGSPEAEALKGIDKTHNAAVPMYEAIETLNSYGLEVTSGIILGLDSDTDKSEQNLIDFLCTPIGPGTH